MKVPEEIRREYVQKGLRREALDSDPIEQFSKWLQEAVAAGVPLPNAMTLATCDESARPSGRMVLLKGIENGGFVFYTNYESRKGKELAQNPYAALVFYWEPLDRQVSIRGVVQKVSAAESDDYFSSRPRGSQLGAWASIQSQPIDSRRALEENFQHYSHRYETGTVPRPPCWGGYVVLPDCIEFWQGRPDRLHDRFRYVGSRREGWTIQRLNP